MGPQSVGKRQQVSRLNEVGAVQKRHGNKTNVASNNVDRTIAGGGIYVLHHETESSVWSKKVLVLLSPLDLQLLPDVQVPH